MWPAYGNRNYCGAAVLLVAASSLWGCGIPDPDPQPAQPTAEVYCVRGLWDVFSLGLDDLADELNADGVTATSVSGSAWPDVAASIEGEAAKPADIHAPILIGHSYGADDAVRLAQALGARGIQVRLLMLLDATAPPPIPANVDRCVHLYFPTAVGSWAPRVFPGDPVVPARDNHHTQIINRPFTEEEFGPDVLGTDHFNLDESELAHKLVIAEVLKALGEPQSTSP